MIAEAERIVASGAHYLWGCQSSGRFSGSGVHMIPNTMGADETGRFLFAARYGHGGACAGRCQHPDVAGRRRYTATSLPPANAAQDSHRWPRYFVDPDTVHPGPSGLVYGESCQDKEHYDCAGFVRHCYAVGTGRAPGRMQGNSDLIWSRGQGPLSNADVYPGDLAYGSGGNHVGILSGRSSYLAASPDCSYHAFAATAGVICVPLTRCNWIAEVRRWRGWDRIPDPS